MTDRYVHYPEMTSALEAFRIGNSRAFAIGSLDSRVTFIGQQARALSFVQEMSRAYDLFDRDILVVGAGIAGTTAALALSREGAKVTLAERGSSILQAQALAEHRFVHPTAYDWAMDPTLRNQPILAGDPAPLPWPYSWRAGPASTVLSTLRENFLECVSSDAVTPINVELNCNVKHIQLDEAGVTAELSEAGASQLFGFVVVAVGFGPEVSRLESAPPDTVWSYWEPDDSLSKVMPPGSTFVSGRGDGALVDAIRAAYGREFNHAQILEHFSRSQEFRRFVSIIVEWSNRTISTRSGYAQDLWNQCERAWGIVMSKAPSQVNLLLPAGVPIVKGGPGISVSHQETWILGGPSGCDFLGGQAAFIHRMIVWLLVKCDHIRVLKLSRVTSVTNTNAGDHGPYHTMFTESESTDEPLMFDRVVLRHGPDPVQYLSQLKGIETNHVQKFRDIAALRLLPPRVGETIVQWANLGHSVLMLQMLPGVRFLAEHPGGPWMMELPVTHSTWSLVSNWNEREKMGHTTGKQQPKAMVTYHAARRFVSTFCQILKEVETPFRDLIARLPTVSEWLLFAGCGAPGKYPWGNGAVTPTRANLAGNSGDVIPGDPSRYLGRGPAGHIDLVGENWEWCIDTSKVPPRAALLGGSNLTHSEDALSPIYVDEKTFLANDVGVRVVLERSRPGGKV